jgi:aminopeptidase N
MSTMRSFLLVGRLALAVLPLAGACARHTSVAGNPQPVARAHAAPATSSLDIIGAGCAEGGAVELLHHDVDLSVQLAPPSLSGKGELRLRARRLTSVVALDMEALQVTEVSSASRELPFRRIGDQTCIELPQPIAAGSELTLEIVWEVPVTRKVPRFAPDQVWAAYNTSAWMPTLQDPSQRATLALRVAAPAELRVVASGRLVAQRAGADNLRIHSFALDHPSPPFLYAFAIGRFDDVELVVDDIKLRALGPPGAELNGVLAITAPIYRFLRARIGVALPLHEYVQVFVVGAAAQEAAGMALLSAEVLDDVRKDPSDDWMFSHELSHQWFAWLIPCADFADFWLNEGFATFLSAAFKEERWGRAAYERERDVWRARSAKVHSQGRDAPISLSPPGAAARKPPRESELQPRGVTYYRGALVMDKLRTELGETAFWAGIQRYAKGRTGRSARTEDLRAALAAASGRDLNDFFFKWVYSAAPDL